MFFSVFILLNWKNVLQAGYFPLFSELLVILLFYMLSTFSSIKFLFMKKQNTFSIPLFFPLFYMRGLCSFLIRVFSSFYYFPLSGDLNLYFCSDTDNSLDTQAPFLPSIEVSVKALVVISSAALAVNPSTSMQVMLCAHHPYIVGTAKRDAIWRVITDLQTR